LGIEDILLSLADRVLDFDEASLVQLQEKYLKKVSEFSPNKEWERAIVVYFMINSVRVKNRIFNERVKTGSPRDRGKPPKNTLKLVK
jgi:hypothetical protein